MTTSIVMYLGSLDHTPSEQLVNLETWHTTALILSEGGEHWRLATDIAQQLGCRDDTLKKWSARRQNRTYKSEFERCLLASANSFAVHIRVISVQGRTIVRAREHMLRGLGLEGLVRAEVRNQKSYLRFGPFSAGQPAAPFTEYFDLPERQAIPLIFICHFLVRMHHQLLTLIRHDNPDIEWVDWQLSPNKLPGDINGPMSVVFSGIMQGAARARLALGNIRILTFRNSSEDHGSVLADNIAGLFAQRVQQGRFNLEPPPAKRCGASLLWEIWGEERNLA